MTEARPQPPARGLSNSTTSSGQRTVGNRAGAETPATLVQTRPPTPTIGSRHKDDGEKKNSDDDLGCATHRWNGYTVVTFAPNDPTYPHNWSRMQKHTTVALMCLNLFVAAFGSSTWSAGEPGFRKEYGFVAPVSALGIALYVVGFAVGPFLWGPLTEVPSWGRKKPWAFSFCLFTLCVIPTAFTQSPPVIFVFRFVSGACAAGQLNNGGGLITDLYEGRDRLAVLALYGLCAWGGPIFAPFLQGLFAAGAGWQWPLRLLFIMCAVCCPPLYFLRETSAAAILHSRARKLRRKTGRSDILSPDQVDDIERQKTGNKITRRDRFNIVFGRPMRMIFTEPIAAGCTLFISFLYAVLYCFFEAFGIVFHEEHGIPEKYVGAVFFSVGAGMFAAVATIQVVARTGYRFKFLQRLQRRLRPADDAEKQHSGDEEDDDSCPEDRLQLAAFVAPLACLSLFGFAWTSPSYTGTTGTVFAIIFSAGFGYSIVIAFTTITNYLSEVFSVFVVSSLAASCIVRSLLAAALPIVTTPMLHNLGTGWGLSILGFAALALIPVPIGLLIYGESFRKRSKMAKEGREALERNVRRKEELEAEYKKDGEDVRGTPVEAEKVLRDVENPGHDK